MTPPRPVLLGEPYAPPVSSRPSLTRLSVLPRRTTLTNGSAVAGLRAPVRRAVRVRAEVDRSHLARPELRPVRVGLVQVDDRRLQLGAALGTPGRPVPAVGHVGVLLLGCIGHRAT